MGIELEATVTTTLSEYQSISKIVWQLDAGESNTKNLLSASFQSV